MAPKIFFGILFLAVAINAADKVCKPKKFDSDTIVCVCDEKYCDFTDPVLPSKGEYLMVTTNKDGLRFAPKYGHLSQPHNDVYNKCMSLLHKRSSIFNIRRDKPGQKILGFGGAFTDAVGDNLNKVTPELVDVFFDTLFTKRGLNYNMARTTIGHCDFSKQEYYYTNKENDWNMESFSLRSEDYELRIPYIKRAMQMVPDLMMTTNIWTVPEWMREDNGAGVRSSIIEKHWDSYCLYIIKFLEAYREEGIKFWSVGYANEPTVTVGAILFAEEAQMFTVWAVNKLAEFAVKHFAPALKKSGFNDTKILFFDDDRDILTSALVNTFFDVEGVKEIFELIGLHSYSNNYVSPSLVDLIHDKQPNATIVNTELSAGQNSGGCVLGKWSHAEFYAKNYIEEMNHHCSGWIDWNLALNMDGGPRYSGTPVNSAIIIDIDNNVFYKQPIYYAIGQFSKFIPRGSTKISMASEFASDVDASAVLRPDGLVVAVLLNKSNYTVDANIKDTKGEIRVNISPNSINTIIF